jgi:hypothetical protein
MSAEIPVRSIPTNYSYLLLTSGWKVLKANYGIILGTTIFQFVLLFILTKIPVIGPLVAGLVTAALAPGVWRMCRKWVAGQLTQFDEIFYLFTDSELLGRVAPLFVIVFIFNSGSTLATWRLLALNGNALAPWSLMWMTLFYLLYGLFTFFSAPLIVLQGKRLSQTLLPSARGILKNLLPLLLTCVLYFVLCVVSLALVILPFVFITLPLAVLVFYLIYATIFEGLNLPEDVKELQKAPAPELANT